MVTPSPTPSSWLPLAPAIAAICSAGFALVGVAATAWMNWRLSNRKFNQEKAARDLQICRERGEELYMLIEAWSSKFTKAAIWMSYPSPMKRTLEPQRTYGKRSHFCGPP
jgi:hypothetical protein